MDDAVLVGGFERLDDLARDRQRVLEWNRAVSDAIGQRGPVDELHHQRLPGRRFLDAVDRRDVRMVQRGEDLRFALEPREALGIGGERRRQDLEGDVALQSAVTRAVDLPHAAGRDEAEDLVRTDPCTDGQGHY